MRSTVRRVGRRTARALVDVASSLGSSRFIGTTKWPRSLEGDSGELLPLRYSYRSSPEGLIDFTALLPGLDLSFRLHTMSFTNGTLGAGDLLLACNLPAIERGDVLTVNVLEPSLSLNGLRLQPQEARHITTRKFVSEIQQNFEGRRYSRLCTHYLPYDDKKIGQDYYFGDDYVDYGKTSPSGGLALLKRYAAHGRLLDIGCALGIFAKAFLDAGLDVCGTDISEFAIEQASLLVGANRVRRADLDADGRVIYVGTLSKIFSPGLRLGWIAARGPILGRLATLKMDTDIHTSALDQHIAARFRSFDAAAIEAALARALGGKADAEEAACVA